MVKLQALVASVLIWNAALAHCQPSAAAAPPVLTMDPRIVDQTCLDAWPNGFTDHGRWVVRLMFSVSAQGELLDARVSRASGSVELDQASLENLKRCTFSPGWVGGQPVAAWSELQRVFVRTSESARVESPARREPKE